MMSWRFRSELRSYLRTALWPWPALFVALGIIVGLAIPRLEGDTQLSLIGDFSPSSATSLLGAFASGFITVLGLTISIAIAALTFGSAAVTPRIIREWQRTQTARVMVGVLLFSIVYAFIVLGQIAPRDNPDYVPDLAVWFVVPLIFLDVLALLAITRGLGRAVRFVETLDEVYARGIEVIDRVFPRRLEGDAQEPASPTRPAGPSSTSVLSARSGVVASVDVPTLRAIAHERGVTVELVPRIGGYVEEGSALVRIWPASDLDTRRLLDAVAVADERTIDQDPLFAIRLMVDIGIRALSPAINDPSTAVQALDRVGDFLHHVIGRRFVPASTAGADQPQGVFIRVPRWGDFLELAFTEFREYGSGSVQVMRRMRAVLDVLRASAPASRQASIDREFALLDAAVERAWADPAQRQIALTADGQGLGGGE